MEQFAIAAQRRDKIGTGPARAYRREGLIPAVIYGHGGESIPLLVAAKDLQNFLRQSGSVAKLDIEGEALETGMGALIKETQRHPISRSILSVDFLRISLTEKVQLNVPVLLVGDAPGVKLEGGVLDQTLYELSIFCLPTNIPEHIEVDVSSLHTGHSLHVRDIVLPEGVEILTSEDESVVTISKSVKSEDLQPQLEGGEAVEAEEEAAGE